MWFRSARLQHCNAFFAQLTTLCNILRGQKPTAIDCNATNRIVKACIMRQNYNCEYEDSLVEDELIVKLAHHRLHVMNNTMVIPHPACLALHGRDGV